MMQKDDYELLRQVVDDALAPVKTDLANLKSDISELRTDLKDVYTKQVMDLKLEALKNELDMVKAQATENEKAIGSFWLRTLERASIVVGVILSIMALISQIAH